MHLQTRARPQLGWRLSTAKLFVHSNAAGVAAASVRDEWMSTRIFMCLYILPALKIHETSDVSRDSFVKIFLADVNRAANVVSPFCQRTGAEPGAALDYVGVPAALGSHRRERAARGIVVL